MSVLDDLQVLEQRVIKRLAELRPHVDEYRELEAIAERLGLDVKATTPATDGQSTVTPTKASRRQRRKSKTPGSPAINRPQPPATGKSATQPSGGGFRRRQVLAAVTKQPGITVREIGAQLGVDPTSLYRSVRSLEADGSIKKSGRQLTPA
jgi:winged helix-turn-helix DNA-binding protein